MPGKRSRAIAAGLLVAATAALASGAADGADELAGHVDFSTFAIVVNRICILSE